MEFITDFFAGINFQQVMWFIIGLAFTGAEIATTSLVCLWFIFGSVIAYFVAGFDTGINTQLIAFLLTSATSLVLLKPFANKLLLKDKVATNADSLIGKQCEIVVAITELSDGRAKVAGMEWLAKSTTPIEVGTICIVDKIDGVGLVVHPITEKSQTV